MLSENIEAQPDELSAHITGGWVAHPGTVAALVGLLNELARESPTYKNSEGKKQYRD